MRAGSAAEAISSIPYRIRIGVTGHRHLQDEAAVRAAVREIVDQRIHDLFDQESKDRLKAAVHTPLRLSVATALAEGADQAVAEEILQTPDSVLVAVLPLEEAEYLETISPAGQDRFRELLSRDRKPERLRRLALKQEFPRYSGDAIQNARRASFEAAGRYVVDHCDLLIVVWDGNPARGRGGTAEVVEYATQRQRPVAVIPATDPKAVEIRPGHGLSAQAIAGVEEFNRMRPKPATGLKYSAALEAEVLNGPGAEGIPETAKAIIRDGLVPYYIRASLMAKRNQSWYYWAGRLGYSLSALAVALVGAAVLFPDYARLAFGLEFLCLAVIIGCVAWTDRRRSHQKWIESRFLTERLRSAFFLAGCGLEASAIETPPYFGPAHRCDDWMVRVFQEIWLRLPPLPPRGKPCEGCREFVRQRWVIDQANHHRGKAVATARLTKLTERIGLALFLIALGAAGCHFLLGDYLEQKLHAGHLGLTLLAIALPGAGSALAGIRSHREYARLEKRSRHMSAVLDDLGQRLAKVDDPGEFESLVREAEDLMLRETQEWLLLMRFTKLEAV